MNNIRQEDRSLLEVRTWKNQCQQEDDRLSPREYLEKMQRIAEQIKLTYHIKLQKVKRSHSFSNVVRPYGKHTR